MSKNCNCYIIKLCIFLKGIFLWKSLKKKKNQMKNKVSTYKKTLKHPFLNLGAFALEIQEDLLIKTKVITQKTLFYRQTTHNMIQAQHYLWLYKNSINPSDKRLHGYSNLIFLSKLKQWLIRNKLMLMLLNFDYTFLFKFLGFFDRHKNG